MEKNNKSLWIGIIIVVVLVALYFLATRGGNNDSDMNGEFEAAPASMEESALVDGAMIDDGLVLPAEIPALDLPAATNDGLVEEVNTPFDPGAMEATPMMDIDQ